MCGIGGYFSATPRSKNVPKAMLAALRQRGPDAEHMVGWDAAFCRTEDAPHHALLHSRLAIIDPRPLADQPMANEQQTIWLCYNGEVYGWQDDAAELRQQGYQFHSHSDTEFILRAYEAWGIDVLLSKLRGMFAFALLDVRQQKLHLVRDRMGEKPLLYAHTADGLAFASLVRSVLPWLPGDMRQFDADAIDAYLAHRYIPAPMTIFKSIRRLQNACRLEYDIASNTLKQFRYWPAAPVAVVDKVENMGDVKAAGAGGNLGKLDNLGRANDPNDSSDVSTNQAVKKLAAVLDESIELRTVADRPLGIFLSGGVDSSFIASRLAALGYKSLQTFTAAFPGSVMDESAEAAEFAGRCGLSNTALAMPQNLAADFARIVADLDEPFADPSSFPTWYLARATSAHVKVVLGGDGGDELFTGYKRYDKHLRHAWRAGLSLPWLAKLLAPAITGKGFSKYMAELAMSWESAYALRFSGCTPAQRAYLQPQRSASSNYRHWWRRPDPMLGEAGQHAALSPIKRLLAWDYANYLPEYVLRKSDLMTLCHGLELRAPFLDHQVVAAVAALPDEQRFTHPAKKILQRICHQLTPIFSRRKRGFNPPLQHWLHHDLHHRFEGLGERLQRLTHGQLDAQRVDAFAVAYRQDERLAEQVLQLLILDESLGQLSNLAADVDGVPQV